MQLPRDTLTTARLVLRRVQPDDLPVYTAYCASERSVYVRGPFSAFQAFENLATMAGHWDLRGFGRYVMVSDGQPIGHVGPLQIDGDALPEMTWTLWDGTAEGQGYAFEAARAVLDHLQNDCGWPKLIARVLPENAGSMRLAERLGGVQGDLPAPHWYPGSVTFEFDRVEVPA